LADEISGSRLPAPGVRFLWGGAALAALWWPGRLIGPLDGLPLDGVWEAILFGLAVPVLWWLHPAYLHTLVARVLIATLLIAKLASSFLVQGGWCVQFETPRPLVSESRGRIHSWDVRADWQSRTPRCSAIITRGYSEFKDFPVWFFNMPPTDSNLPRLEDRPPFATLDMNVLGYIDAAEAGQLEVQSGPSMTTTLIVDGQPSGSRAAVAAGRHAIEIRSHLTDRHWRFVPSWNGAPMGSAGFASATVAPPSDFDAAVRGPLNWLIHLVAPAIVIGWLAMFASQWADRTTLLFALAASAVVGWLGAHPGDNYVMTPWARWSITALAAAMALRLSPAAQNLRGAFLLIGVPWLAFVTAVHASHIGRFSFYAPGDDMWMFQRFAYRIYLQGYWLQGGELTFWFQPFYRWIAGALHLVFGDSSMGEFWWDALSLLASALFAHLVVATAYGYRWGLAAAVLCLTIVMHGPAWGFIGIGLSDTASAGFIYFGALLLLSARLRGDVPVTTGLLAGTLAAIGFYTRLNNLLVATGIAVFALPLMVRSRDLWRARAWWSQISWRGAVGVAAAIAIALCLFAWRTYHYTGVFSVLHGTTWRNHALWDAGQPLSQIIAAMSSSLMMVLTFNDPPRFTWYALPLLCGAVVAVLAVLRVPRIREVPLAPVLFFVVGCSAALAARGVAYSGRFSIHLAGVGCALTMCGIAALVTRREPSRSSDPVRG